MGGPLCPGPMVRAGAKTPLFQPVSGLERQPGGYADGQRGALGKPTRPHPPCASASYLGCLMGTSNTSSGGIWKSSGSLPLAWSRSGRTSKRLLGGFQPCCMQICNQTHQVRPPGPPNMAAERRSEDPIASPPAAPSSGGSGPRRLLYQVLPDATTSITSHGSRGQSADLSSSTVPSDVFQVFPAHWEPLEGKGQSDCYMAALARTVPGTGSGLPWKCLLWVPRDMKKIY